MKKACALVSGIILSIAFVFVPFTGALADSSVALPQFVFSLMFSNVSISSTIDVTNYNAATGNISTDSSVHLYNTAGSYSQINRQGINIAQNLLCLRFTIDNPSSGFFDDLIIEPYINGSPAHLYGTYTQSDNSNSITYYMFFYIGADTLRVKDVSGQDITPWGIRFTRTNDITYSWSFSSSSTSLHYYNYTLQSQTVDPGEAAELALDIINVLQLSQLSEKLGIVAESLDTTTLESLSQSILQVISDQYSIDSSSQVNIAVRGYASQTVTTNPIDIPGGNDFYIPFRVPGDYTYNLYVIDIPMYYDPFAGEDPDYAYPISDIYIGGGESINGWSSANYTSGYFGMWTRVAESPGVYYTVYRIYVYSPDITNPIFMYIKLNFDKEVSVGGHKIIITKYKSNTLQFQTLLTNWIHDIWLSITSGNDNVPSDVQTTTDDINQNATTVNNFQSSTQQSLDQDLQDVPVVDYQIQATTGTQYMRAYSEALFNASNGFRIWYMLPLILFVIGMLIRWGVKK